MAARRDNDDHLLEEEEEEEDEEMEIDRNDEFRMIRTQQLLRARESFFQTKKKER